MPEITAMPLFLHHLYLTENLTNISFTGKQRLESCCFLLLLRSALTKVIWWKSQGQALLPLSPFWPTHKGGAFNEGVEVGLGGN